MTVGITMFVTGFASITAGVVPVVLTVVVTIIAGVATVVIVVDALEVNFSVILNYNCPINKQTTKLSGCHWDRARTG